MEIRKLGQQEYQDSRRLYEEVFEEDSASFVDYYYTEKTRDNQIYVVEADGGIRSMLHLNPYRLYVNGSGKDVNYIVAVATQKEYRKRGYMSALLKTSLNDMYQAGESFTFLMPASESIYAPFDFRTVYEQNRRFYRSEDEEAADIAITDAKDEDCRELAGWANQRLAERYQVFAIRDEAYYQRLIREYECDGGSLKIYRRDGQIVDCRGCYPNVDNERPKIMVRIVDVRRMLMALRLRSLTGVCFCVTDPLIRENNRCLVVTGTEFSGVMLMDGKEENSEGTITVAALTSLIFGAGSVEDVCREEGVEMSQRMKEEVGKWIPLSGICLNEAV
ncbi:GNAT family N-acetyltransferase [Lachnospiraceae bacterium 62-26]